MDARVKPGHDSFLSGRSSPGFASGSEAFRWTAGGGMVGLGDLDGGIFSSAAYGVSGDGLVVVGQGASAAGFEAFRWTESGGMVALGDLNGGPVGSIAYGVSDDGGVIVGAGIDDFTIHAFIWDELGGMRLLSDVLTDDFGLDLTGWHLREARAISADGRVIVGTGTNPDGMVEAWIVSLRQDEIAVPTPGTLALFGAGLLALGLLRRDARRAHGEGHRP